VDQGGETYTVAKGDLLITVVESGSLEAANSIDIASEVPHQVKILEIVEEGTNITDEDVKEGKVLVKLDSSNMEDQLFEHESNLESAKASLTEAKEELAIQTSDNQSNIRSAELEVTYAHNDLRKLVGDTLADDVLANKPENLAALLDHPDLGGQALQDLLKNQSDIELVRIKLARAEEKLKYTQKLYDKQYVSKNELEADELDKRTQELSVQTAEGKLLIFRQYDFVKNFQKTWATLLEAQEKLERARAVARSRLAQAEAKLKSREAGFERTKQRLEELRQNIDKCTIVAKQPGFVVYQPPPRWQNTGPIRAGSEIRPRQTILQLPDLSRMAVNVGIHEAQIDSVQVGQEAAVTVEAIPNRTFSGTVTKKAVIPSSQSSWLNPDLKVYETKITVNESDPVLRPGMTATIEIVAEKLENVLYVPIQSVLTDEKGEHTVCLADGSRVTVQLGKRNRIFVQVVDGLNEGQVVLMTPPELVAEKEE
jgi:HlyD family secretion protein